MIALQLIKDNFRLMQQAIRYHSITDTWNQIKQQSTQGKKNIINAKITNCKPEWLQHYYKALYNFVNAASILGYQVNDTELSMNTLNAIYSTAQAVCTEYAMGRCRVYKIFF